MTITLIDESTRPTAPKIEGATPAHRRQGRHLAMIHAMHLQQIAEVERVIRQIESGEAEMAKLGQAISGLQMAANYRQFGNLCGQECQVLNFHHTAEDRQIFPALMKGSEGLRRVVERLIEEHAVIHGLIETMEAQAVSLIQAPDPARFQTLRRTFATLLEIVRSHFGYEQVELEEALGYYQVLS
jgi:hypothetical protein